MSITKIIAGLGNPGQKYAKQRHNIGFTIADRLLSDYGGERRTREKFSAQVSELCIAAENVLLIKPQRFMNLSGQSIAEAMRFYRVENNNLWVLHDELDLPFGELRPKLGGGSAGHNGVKNIIAHLGENFHRLRFGIGHPRDKIGDELVQNYVLHDFSAEEAATVERLCACVSRYMSDILHHEYEPFLKAVAEIE